MSEGIRSSSSIAAVPEDIHEKLLIDGTDVESKVGHVAKFGPGEKKSSNIDQFEEVIEPNGYKKKGKENTQFIGLTKEELKSYINDPSWKRIRWIIAIVYILILLALLVASICLIIFSQRCPPKPKLVWHEKDIIYEIDLPTFYDSDGDGIGDIKGLEEKLPYLESNNIKSILLQSSIFDTTAGTSIQLGRQSPQNKTVDLITIDEKLGNDNQLQEFIKILNRRDMRLIIDLPLSSTSDPNGNQWYGSESPLPVRIINPCGSDRTNLACRYYDSYGRLPLDFSNAVLRTEAESRIRHWLSKQKVDGIRVNLPIFRNASTGLYNISYDTIQTWTQIKEEIEKKTKPKLLLFDIPFDLQDLIKDDSLHSTAAHSLLLSKTQQRSKINAAQLNQRIQSFKRDNLSKPRFWQLGSKRRSDDVGIISDRQLPKEMVLTLAMLYGGTPVVLYGEELGLDQKSFPLMPWTPNGPYGGFTSCSNGTCVSNLSPYKVDLSKTSVKLQEASGGSKDSLLTIFRRLSKLRQSESFQFGLLETGDAPASNIYWFIREAPGYRGYVIIFNLGESETKHISLYELTKQDVPLHIHYEYQWPTIHFPTSNTTHINSDNLLIHPRSINIFWWAPKLIKPNILFQNAKEHSH